MSNPLAKKHTFLSLLRFTLPTIIMMVFMSIYTMVDGVFVSNLIGESALSAVNIAYPMSSIVLAVSIMLATGGSAVIARKMGEGKPLEAKQNFSLIVVTGIAVGIVIAIVGTIFIKPIINLLGATPMLYEYTYGYLQPLIIFAPFCVLQMLFQYFFVTAGKPKLGLITTLMGGVANIILDYVFIVPLDMGIAGAAIATGIGYSIPAIAGLVYFTCNKKGTLHFVKPVFEGKVLLESSLNGSSEMVTNLATAMTTLLFNLIMVKYLGESGVTAITIVLYAQFLLTAIYLGFSSGVAPVLSYNCGEENYGELKRLFKISMIFIAISSVAIFAFAMIFSPNIVSVFVKRESEVFGIAMNGFLIFGMSYLFTGFNIFASSMFTAFSNGKVSAIISFARTFAFIVPAIIFLPKLVDTNGIWLAVPIAELLTVCLSLAYFIKLKKVYKYA